jgi:crotonobetainyl-CoA:carnitine CoA-transferase CaiB-like acyl-CoA transferase
MTLPNGVETKTFGSPIRFDLQTTPIRSMPPGLDEHGAEIRKELAEGS